ncbi:MAG: bifunctional precorrin-2 dehydrogenase/sirohydrochlorin ferrochelatase [Hominilimicola sp.]
MYPIMLNIEGRQCTVIGGGKVALRKAKKLKEHGGTVTAVAPKFITGFDGIKTIQKHYTTEDIKNAFLVIAATNDSALNKQIAADAKALNILVSLADDAGASDFMSPASAAAGDITLSVSTGGKFPLLSKKLCDVKSEDLALYNLILPILEKYRQQIIAEDRDTKKELLEYLISDKMLEIARGDITLFEQKIKEKL